jgi:hypothetical protein
MSKVQIVVNVFEGMVQAVFCSAEEAEFILIDWDCDRSDRSAPDVAQITDSDGDEVQALVLKCTATPIEELAGTECEAAIQYARAHSFEDFENEPDLPKPDSTKRSDKRKQKRAARPRR